MERGPLYIQVNTTNYLPDGSSISASINEKPKGIKPSNTAKHEALHIVASNCDIIEATIIPDGDSLGKTIPRRMTAAGAAAAHAMGYDGTGHDMQVAAFLGYTQASADALAHNALLGKQEEVEEIAIALEENGSIGQSHVDEALRRVDDRKKGNHLVLVTRRDRNGREDTMEARSDHQIVMVPGELYAVA